MHTIQLADQVVSMAPNGETIEVYTVVKVLADGVQVDGTSGKISKAELRVYREDTVNQIQRKGEPTQSNQTRDQVSVRHPR